LGFLTMPWLARGARKHCQEFLGGPPEIGVFYLPYYLPMRRALKPKFTVYHPIDDYAVYWPKRAERTLRLEDEMIRCSDLVVCTGLFLRDEFRQKFPERAHRIHHLPNPVPLEYLVAQPLPRTVFRGDGTDVRRPVLGYIGNFEYRLHAPVICALAEAFPWAEIKLRTKKPSPDPFAGYANVQYVEPMSKDDLMKFVRSFDVCLVPQAPNHFNYVASPRKMYEYIASSRPVVTLNTPEAAPLAPYVHNATSVTDFVERVRGLLLQGEPEDYPRRRLALAADLTASPLANRYADLLAEMCAQKGVALRT
jgi:glycosyltransferase involved in cell wall biosynthesis